ncbi:MAG: hypothetical protein IKP38_06910 [Clostridia bacterium]|nr:hypothetical protein [Clostridia bacterium]
MRTVRRLVSVLLLLCFVVGCARTVSLDYGKTATFSEAKAKPFDPSEHKGTVWEWKHGVLTVSETGEVRVTFFRNCYNLIPEDDHFAIEVPLYRTLTDDEPAFTVPAGTARLLNDGDLVWFRITSDLLHCFSEEQKDVCFQTADTTQLKRYYTSFSVDYEPFELLIQSQPNTEWRNWYSGIMNGPSTNLSTDPNGAASGTIYAGSTETECELLIGHRGNNKLCAIVKKNPQSIDDVLLFGTHCQSENDRTHTRRFEMSVSYDPKQLLDERSGGTFCLYSQVELEDSAEKNWIGMNLFEYFHWMEKDGWQIEEIVLFAYESGCLYCLRKGDETILISAGRDFEPVPFGDLYVAGYVRYLGRTVQSWAGHTPKDHTIADRYELQEGQYCAFEFHSAPYSPATGNEYYFLDDCRVIGIQFDWNGTGEEDEIQIYDALTGEIN